MMANKLRIFPTLTILDGALVKTQGYKNPRYLGDPINAIKLFNNKTIDEICVLDISSNFSKGESQLKRKLLSEMSAEAFIPLSYGGNINSLKDAKDVIELGFEKVIVNSLFHNNLDEVKVITKELGSQSVVLKIDYTLHKENIHFYSNGKILDIIEPNKLIEKINESKVGEVVLSRVDYDGMMRGYDLGLFPTYILKHTNLPIVLSSGAKDKFSILEASEIGFNNFTASSLFVYIGHIKGILINNPF